jgi:hypothetical protein
MPTAGILLRVTAAQTAKTVKPIPLVSRERCRGAMVMAARGSKPYSPMVAPESAVTGPYGINCLGRSRQSSGVRR